MEKIMQSRMDRGFFRYQSEYEEAALRVLRSGWYILGREVEFFEREFASFLGVSHCVGVGNGLDALWIGMRLLGIGPGDEVIVQGNAYIASVMGITINGAKPVFVEPDAYDQLDPEGIEEKLSERTKAVLVVHLYGHSARMDRIRAICEQHRLLLIEDCAQSHGAKFNGRQTGTFGNLACFSFYPSKNLGAFGDGGAIVTEDADLAKQARIFRNYGSEKRYHNQVVGANSRLDELQAALLRVKLSHLEELNAERRALAAYYLEGISNPALRLPKAAEGTEPVWHQFVIHANNRDRLMAYLEEQGISTLIHYPIPPHLSEAYRDLEIKPGKLPVTERYAGEVLSLPLYNGMSREEQDRVIRALNAWRG